MQADCYQADSTVTTVLKLLSQAAAVSSTTAGGTANQQQAAASTAAAAAVAVAVVRPTALLQRQRSVNLHNTTAAASAVGNSTTPNSTNSGSIVSSVLNSAYNWLYPPPEVSALELAANSLKSQPVTPTDHHHDSAERGDIPLVARNAAYSNSSGATATAAVAQVKEATLVVLKC
jgi:hypothetical protein